MGRPRKNPDDPKWAAKQGDPVLLVAAEDFFMRGDDGADHGFTANVTRIMSDHPWVKGNEHLFKPAGPSRGYEVEQATAAPGEHRP